MSNQVNKDFLDYGASFIVTKDDYLDYYQGVNGVLGQDGKRFIAPSNQMDQLLIVADGGISIIEQGSRQVEARRKYLQEEIIKLEKELDIAMAESAKANKELAFWEGTLLFTESTANVFSFGFYGRGRAATENPTAYTVANNYTYGLVDTVNRTFNNDKPLSLDHWLNSAGLVGYIAGTGQFAKNINAIKHPTQIKVTPQPKPKKQAKVAEVVDDVAKNTDEIVDGNKGGLNSVDDFISSNVNPKFQQNVRGAFTEDIKVSTLTKDTVAYRYHGGSSLKNSYWYTPNRTANPAADLALPKGNAYQHMETVIIPKKTTILAGTVERNFGQPGGGYQYYVPDPSVIIKY